MPSLTRLFLRAALLYILIGFTLGALLLANKGVPISPHIWRLLPAHMETLLLGWLLLLALGVAYWILPRFKSERPHSWLVWLSFGLLNVGIACISLAPFIASSGQVGAIGRILETLGVLTFALHAWPRIKPAGA